MMRLFFSPSGRIRGILLFFLTLLLVTGLLLGAAVTLLRQEKTEIAQQEQNPDVTILRAAENKVETLPLEEVVVGVLAGEMPASFEPAALEAQAVAARTYILKRLPEPYGSGLAVHTDNASICDDYAHCQAYVDEAQRQKNWGEKFQANEEKIRRAVTATAGQIITYDGEPISPTFCSTCGGQTEAAGDYWQSDVPALQSVACYWDTDAPKYLSTVTYTAEEMASKLGIQPEELTSLKIASTSASGRVTLVTCGDKRWKGSSVRTALGLNSTNFQWLEEDGKYLITIQGYGHGVGLCQHGANGMAAAGAGYQEILHHYYTDIEISQIGV